MEDINAKLLAAISHSLPTEREIVGYLSELLSLNRKSVLRKIRGESQLSMDEVSLISSKFNFSLDEIIGQCKKGRIYYDIDPNVIADPEGVFMQTFIADNKILKEISQAKNKLVITCLNSIFSILFSRYEKILEFTYYKYIQRVKPGTLYLKMSELAIPPEFTKLREERLEMTNMMENAIYIVDSNIFFRAAKEILYYYERKLISEQELILLKDELYRMLESGVMYVQSGSDKKNVNLSIYYSMSNINSNCTYYEYDKNIYSQFWPYLVNPIAVSDPDICSFQKRWLESLKKKSMLITQSNEMAQTDFIMKLRKDMNSIIVNNR
jgi:hypothetical protein